MGAEFYIYFILSFTFDFMMVFAPIIGYIAQLSKIRENKSSEGFSKKIILILLIANILRIFFWFGKKFATPLLLQSIVMIIMQLVLLRYCVLYSNVKPSITIYEFNHFWDYPFFFDYIYILGIVIFFLVALSNMFTFENHIYVETLGLLSASVEACLGLPQIYQNFKQKSTKSLSIVLVATWVFGDLFKTFYFIRSNAPFQLIGCGVFQIIADFLVIFQIYYYSQEKILYKTLKQTDEDIKLVAGVNKI
jgi:hypothetical protein